MLSSCLNALAAVHSSHTLTTHTFLSVSVMLCICMFQPSIDGKLVPVNVLKLVFIWQIFLSICYPLALVFSLPVLCHRLCVSASTPPPFEGQSSSKQRAIPAEVIGSPGMKTQAVKLQRGISTSHYLVVSMHLTHSSLEELQCMTSRI